MPRESETHQATPAEEPGAGLAAWLWSLKWWFLAPVVIVGALYVALWILGDESADSPFHYVLF